MNTKSKPPGSDHRWLPWFLLVVAAAGSHLDGGFQLASLGLALVAGIWLLCRLLRLRDLGIMGGAFNPIHNGHLDVAECALEQFRMFKVLFIPSGNPPHKKEGLLDKELRFELVEEGVADYPLFEASRLEVDRPGITWTIDTLKELRKQYPWRVRLNFIIGEDNIATIANYDRKHELLSLCRLIVCPRVVVKDGIVRPVAAAEVDVQKKLESWRQALPPGAQIEVLDYSANELSSTLVRTLVAAGKSIAGLVPERVRRIILARGYYRPEPPTTLDQPAA